MAARTSAALTRWRRQAVRRMAASRAATLALVARLPEPEIHRPRTQDRWSVKDVLWHIAFWWDDLKKGLERNWVDEADEDDTDEVNAREQAASRVLPYVEVRAELDDARIRLLETWGRIPGDDERGAEVFLSETIEHYEEHEPQIRSLVDDPHVKARGA